MLVGWLDFRHRSINSLQLCISWSQLVHTTASCGFGISYTNGVMCSKMCQWQNYNVNSSVEPRSMEAKAHWQWQSKARWQATSDNYNQQLYWTDCCHIWETFKQYRWRCQDSTWNVLPLCETITVCCRKESVELDQEECAQWICSKTVDRWHCFRHNTVQ